tara:strand:+ start:412 stop:1080 length:669 start_codon:yes stop_codon:yes gene_type:complete
MSKSKLQNVKAVREMISGTHKSQTRKSHYYGNTKTDIPEEDIIEKFDNGNLKIWIETDPTSGARTRITQNDGFKSRESESGYLIRQLRNELSMPSMCPKCDQDMSAKEARLNNKFWVTHKSCYDCVIKEEHIIKMKGPEAWDEYQRGRMLENAKSFFKDADGDVEGLRNMLTKELKNVQNADGDLETFEKAMSDESFDDTILKEYDVYKQAVLNGFNKERKV